MTHSVSALPSEFDGFLFAPIGEDGHGMLLSVLSALARLDVDPWQEAATLAQLPKNTATERLASLIATLPDGSLARPDPRTIAGRLIALLPRQSGSHAPSREASSGVEAATKTKAVAYVICYAILVAFVLGTQGIIASHRLAARVDTAHAPVSSTVSPEAPLAKPSP
jgi:hypothetical protein